MIFLACFLPMLINYNIKTMITSIEIAKILLNEKKKKLKKYKSSFDAGLMGLGVRRKK
jgi:alanine racemase